MIISCQNPSLLSQSSLVFCAAESFSHLIRFGPSRTPISLFADKIKRYSYEPNVQDLAANLERVEGEIWRDSSGWRVQLH